MWRYRRRYELNPTEKHRDQVSNRCADLRSLFWMRRELGRGTDGPREFHGVASGRNRVQWVWKPEGGRLTRGKSILCRSAETVERNQLARSGTTISTREFSEGGSAVHLYST